MSKYSELLNIKEDLIPWIYKMNFPYNLLFQQTFFVLEGLSESVCLKVTSTSFVSSGVNTSSFESSWKVIR